MRIISSFDENKSEGDDGAIADFWSDIFYSPSFKSLLLDNVRSISYNITDVTEDGDKATVSAMITHNDISPIFDKTIEIDYH